MTVAYPGQPTARAAGLGWLAAVHALYPPSILMSVYAVAIASSVTGYEDGDGTWYECGGLTELRYTGLNQGCSAAASNQRVFALVLFLFAATMLAAAILLCRCWKRGHSDRAVSGVFQALKPVRVDLGADRALFENESSPSQPARGPSLAARSPAASPLLADTGTAAEPSTALRDLCSGVRDQSASCASAQPRVL